MGAAGTRFIEARDRGGEVWRLDDPANRDERARWGLALRAGVVWLKGPDIPEFSIAGYAFGPELPGQGLAAALGLWVSALATWALIVYSVKRYR